MTIAGSDNGVHDHHTHHTLYLSGDKAFGLQHFEFDARYKFFIFYHSQHLKVDLTILSCDTLSKTFDMLSLDVCLNYLQYALRTI